MNSTLTYTVFDLVAAGIIIFSKERILYANPAAQRLSEQVREHNHLFDLLHPDDHDHLQTVVTGVKHRVMLHQGKRRFIPVEMTFAPFIEGSEPVYVATVIERADDEALREALFKSEERYRILSEINADFAFVFYVEQDGRLTREWITEAFERVTGFTPDESEDRGGWAALTYPDDLPRVAGELRRILQTPSEGTLDYRIITKNGQVKYMRNYHRSIYSQSEGRVTHIYATARDITASRQVEEELRRSEQTYRTLAQNFPNGIVALFDHDLRYFLVEGKGMEQPEGMKAHMEGKRLRDIFPPEIYERDEPALLAALAGQETRSEVSHEGRDYLVQTAPVFDTNGDIIAGLVMTQDMTEHKRAQKALIEQERLSLELQKHNEIEALRTQIMHRIGHEFRNPLSVISVLSEVLERYGDKLMPQERADRFNQIRVQVKSLTETLEDVWMAAKGDFNLPTLQLLEFDLGKLCREQIDTLLMTSGSLRSFSFNTDESLCCFRGDLRLIRYVVTNLLTNAIKYSGERTSIEVEAYAQNDMAVLVVRDHGTGMSEEDRQRIFEPFYRGANSKSVNGIGVGMSIVYNIVHAHKGTIEVESELGVGTTVTVRLPLDS
jgi:PAS domain S-box-containing protein